MTQVPLGGLRVDGFRSFAADDTQTISPLSMVPLLAGRNNSASPNVLRMAKRVMSVSAGSLWVPESTRESMCDQACRRGYEGTSVSPVSGVRRTPCHSVCRAGEGVGPAELGGSPSTPSMHSLSWTTTPAPLPMLAPRWLMTQPLHRRDGDRCTVSSSVPVRRSCCRPLEVPDVVPRARRDIEP
jgi:hypothetical protein